MLKEASDIDAQLEKLREEMQKLRVHDGKLHRFERNNQFAVTVALEAFAKVDCRKFCDDVYRYFPREIRDNIYGHIHTTDKVSITTILYEEDNWGPSESVTYFDFTSEARWRTGLPGDRSEAHLWNAECIGDRMLRELIEYYYRSTCFCFGSEFHLIPRYQFTDQWKIGAPPMDFVTNVGVSVICDGSNFDATPSKKEFCCKNTDIVWVAASCHLHDHKPTNTRQDELLANLQTLFGFQVGTKISIKIHARRACDGILGELAYARNTVVPIIFPTLQRLSKRGYLVKVTLAEVVDSPFGLQVPKFVVDGAIPTLDAWAEEVHKVGNKNNIASRYTC